MSEGLLCRRASAVGLRLHCKCGKSLRGVMSRGAAKALQVLWNAQHSGPGCGPVALRSAFPKELGGQAVSRWVLRG